MGIDIGWDTHLDALKRRVLEIDRRRWELDIRMADLLALAVEAEKNFADFLMELRIAEEYESGAVPF